MDKADFIRTLRGATNNDVGEWWVVVIWKRCVMMLGKLRLLYVLQVPVTYDTHLHSRFQWKDEKQEKDFWRAKSRLKGPAKNYSCFLSYFLRRQQQSQEGGAKNNTHVPSYWYRRQVSIFLMLAASWVMMMMMMMMMIGCRCCCSVRRKSIVNQSATAVSGLTSIIMDWRNCLFIISQQLSTTQLKI